MSANFKPLNLSLGHALDWVGFCRFRYRYLYRYHYCLDWHSNLCRSCHCLRMPLILHSIMVKMWPLGSWLPRDFVAGIWGRDIVRLPFVLSGEFRGLGLWLRIGVLLRGLLVSSRACQRDGSYKRKDFVWSSFVFLKDVKITYRVFHFRVFVFVGRPLTAESAQVANVLIEFLCKEKIVGDLFIKERILIRNV